VVNQRLSIKIPSLAFIPRLGRHPADIAATVHNGKHKHSAGFQTIHDPLTLDDDFPKGFVFRLWDHAAAFRKMLKPPRS